MMRNTPTSWTRVVSHMTSGDITLNLNKRRDQGRLQRRAEVSSLGQRGLLTGHMRPHLIDPPVISVHIQWDKEHCERKVTPKEV